MAETSGKIQVMLADDHAVLRAGLKMLINSQADMEVVGEARDGPEATKLAAEKKPDVVVMDISMPGGGGIKAVEQIRREAPRTRVLVLSMHEDLAYVRTALSAGAVGYVSKQAADSELLHGIRAVADGQTFIDPTLAGVVGEDEVDAGPALPSLRRLSAREKQVLGLLMLGHTNQQIADKLGLSVKTAETYRARVAKKLGLRDRADFVRYGLETGLLTGEKRESGPE